LNDTKQLDNRTISLKTPSLPRESWRKQAGC